jgi:hypothetical protein
MHGNALISQRNFFLRMSKNRLPDPSEIYASDFAREFPRFENSLVSATIGINWSIFDLLYLCPQDSRGRGKYRHPQSIDRGKGDDGDGQQHTHLPPALLLFFRLSRVIPVCQHP